MNHYRTSLIAISSVLFVASVAGGAAPDRGGGGSDAGGKATGAFRVEMLSARTLFEKPSSQGEYRIPGILALENGTVLAFCADRKGRGDFGHETTTVLRRSTDGGETWGPIREIAARPGTDIHSGPVVHDRATGRIFKFCRFWPAAKNAKTITNSKTYAEMTELGWIDHVQTSDDGGRTWTKPKRMKMDFPPDVHSAATGNGVHGIQLSSGRLLIQGGYSERAPDGRLPRRCCVFASDDHGEHWRRILDMDTADINVIREFVMAEKQNGEVYYNIRSTTGWRAVFDGSKPRDDDELRDVQCHAGLAVRPRGDGHPIWFFTHPDPVGEARQYNFSRRRQRLVLRISEDEGKTWPGEFVVHESAAAYSDVAVAPDGTVLVLFENGTKVGRPYQRISCARIHVED
ncbi:MAG: sialidase family protein [Planctomycetota bacterium]